MGLQGVVRGKAIKTTISDKAAYSDEAGRGFRFDAGRRRRAVADRFT